jgi:hypothetical protein
MYEIVPYIRRKGSRNLFNCILEKYFVGVLISGLSEFMDLYLLPTFKLLLEKFNWEGVAIFWPQ